MSRGFSSCPPPSDPDIETWTGCGYEGHEGVEAVSGALPGVAFEGAGALSGRGGGAADVLQVSFPRRYFGVELFWVQ